MFNLYVYSVIFSVVLYVLIVPLVKQNDFVQDAIVILDIDILQHMQFNQPTTKLALILFLALIPILNILMATLMFVLNILYSLYKAGKIELNVLRYIASAEDDKK